MSEPTVPADSSGSEEATPFDSLIADAATAFGAAFTTSFRGYDKDEVDAAISGLSSRMRATDDEVLQLKQHQRRAGAAVAQSRAKADRLEAELEAVKAQRTTAVDDAAAEGRAEIERLTAQLAAADAKHQDDIARLRAEVSAARAQDGDVVQRLEIELAAARAQVANAEQQVQALSEELVATPDETPNRHQFEEILRVAEEQASVLIRNASVQGDRLLEAARAENANRRTAAVAEAEAILAHAHHDSQQARLKIDTELTAHQATLEREAAHAAEKVAQAEREATAIRSEAEKGAAALRSMVARETERDRSEAEEAVRELRVRALEFEESLTRRQDDAHQEFLVLHTQAVAHAERITQDANEQVAASLDHAQRVSSKAEDFERLQRAQAQQIDADARLRAREHLDQARVKAQKIMDLVTSHSQTVLRDAEDRTRQLRWQQHQLTSFMSEVKELIRPEGPLSAVHPAAREQTTDADAPSMGDVAFEPGVEAPAAEAAADDDVSADDVDAELAQLVEQNASTQDAEVESEAEAGGDRTEADGAGAEDSSDDDRERAES